MYHLIAMSSTGMMGLSDGKDRVILAGFV